MSAALSCAVCERGIAPHPDVDRSGTVLCAACAAAPQLVAAFREGRARLAAEVGP